MIHLVGEPVGREITYYELVLAKGPKQSCPRRIRNGSPGVGYQRRFFNRLAVTARGPAVRFRVLQMKRGGGQRGSDLVDREREETGRPPLRSNAGSRIVSLRRCWMLLFGFIKGISYSLPLLIFIVLHC